MAEEVKEKDPIIDEDEQLKAQLDAIKRGEQPEPPEEAAAAEPIPPTETPPAETPPAAEAKPAEEVKPVAEETRPPAGKAWQALRAAEKKLMEEREALAEEKRQLAARDQPKEPDFESQPADYLKARQDRIDRELEAERQERQRVQQQLAQRDYIDGIKNQEQAFSKDHPDYFKATEYLIDKDIKQWERAGLSTVHTNQILQAARSGDPRYAAYRQNVERLANDSGVLSIAEKQGRDPEEVAAYVIARDSWLTQRRDLLAEGAKAQGRSVAEVAYEEAVDRGWNGNPQDSKTKEQEAAARARVKQAQEVSAASRSLSDGAGNEAGPERRMLTKRQQLIDADEATLDEAIRTGQYKVME